MPHTHVEFCRRSPRGLRRRLAGSRYAEIAAEGGGILSTVVATRAADRGTAWLRHGRRLDRCCAAARRRARAKSGYGLTRRRRAEDAARRGCAGRVTRSRSRRRSWARTIPIEYRDRRPAYIRRLIDEDDPAVASRAALAAGRCDVFWRDRRAHARRVARGPAGARAPPSLKLRIHADELGRSGGFGDRRRCWRCARRII